MSKLYTFLKGIIATMLLLFVPGISLAQDAASLGEHITSLDQLSSDKTYMIYNENYTAYAVYDATKSTSNVWAANISAHGGNALENTPFELDVTSKAQSWLVSYTDGKLYIQNRETGKYLTTGRGNNFRDDATALTVVDLGDGKFAFSGSGDQYDYFCASPQLAGTPIAIWETSDDGASWEFIENPNVSAVDAPAMPAALAGNYTIKIGSYSTSDADMFDPSTDAKKAYDATLSINAKGEIILTGFLGTPRCGYMDYTTESFVKIDSSYVGIYDEATQTVTFTYPEAINGNQFQMTDLNTYMSWIPKNKTFTAAVSQTENGSYVLTVDGDLLFTYNEATATMHNVRFRAEGADPEVLPAPADMAGTYTVKLGTPTFADESVTLDVADTYKATITIADDGKAHMVGLIGTPSQITMDPIDGMTTTDSCYVGTYDDEAQTITFEQPADFPIIDITTGNTFQLKDAVKLAITKNSDGTYTLSTADNVVYDAAIVDEYGNQTATTLTFAGATFTGRKAVTIAKEDLVGTWSLTYTTLDMDSGEPKDADSPATFTIGEEDGDLYLTGLAGGTHKWPIVYSATGIELPIGMDETTGESLTSDLYGFSSDPVKFAFVSDNSMELDGILVATTDNGANMFVATSGTAVKAEKVDPAPAEMAGTYTVRIAQLTTSDDAFSADDLAGDSKGTITIGEDGNAYMTGLVGTPVLGSGSMNLDPTTTSAYVGKYNAADHTITFSMPEGYCILYATDDYYFWTLAKPFTLQVEQDDDGLYMLSTINPVVFTVTDDYGSSYTVNANGVALLQKKAISFTDEELVGKWKMSIPEADPETGIPTGNSTDFTFTIAKAETTGEADEAATSEYVMTDVQGGDYTFNVSRVNGGIKVAGTYQYVSADTPYTVLLSSTAMNTSDVTFDFNEDKTMTLSTELYFQNEKVSGIVIDRDAIAEKVAEDTPLPLGEAVTSIADLDPTKAYVLYNPTDKVYAVSNPDQEVNIWAANVPGETAFNATAIEFDVTSAHSSWMVVKKDGSDKIAIYNLGAKKYLTTPCVTDGSGAPSTFTDELTYLTYEDLGDGKFAFSTTGNTYDYFCSAAQNANNPMANWSSDDHGCTWQFVENPNVEADAEIAGIISGINTAITETPAAQGIYTINGVKLNVTDVRKLQKGLYIVNGKKLIVK